MELLIYGLISAAAIFVLFVKLDIKKILGYDVWIDLAFTIFLGYILQGSFAGMMAALIGGLALSVILGSLKYLIGYKKLTLKGWKEFTR